MEQNHNYLHPRSDGCGTGMSKEYGEKYTRPSDLFHKWKPVSSIPRYFPSPIPLHDFVSWFVSTSRPIEKTPVECGR